MAQLNSDFPLRDQGVSNALEIDSLSRHRWYFVKEGFSPKLVEQAIATDGVCPGECLLDPFSGGGTSALAAVMHGLRFTGFEVNPFLRFLSRTKIQKGSELRLRRAALTVLRRLERPVDSPLEGFSTFTKGNRWNRWLFPTSVLRSFESGRRATAEMPHSEGSLLRLALIGAAMDCCNAVRDGKCLRYPKKWESGESTVDDLSTRFKIRTDMIATDLTLTPLVGAEATLLEGDARQLIKKTKNKFRICITSPPYLNSFDYSDVYRPELFLGNFVGSTKALMKVRLKTVRSHVQAQWRNPTVHEFGVLYERAIRAIRDRASQLWDQRLPMMIQAYFEDLQGVLRGLRRRAQNNASVWLVVSTSAYAGVEVPVDLILAEIAQQQGWFLREVGVLRHLRSSSQHVQHVEDTGRKSIPLRESVVILDAAPRGTRSN
jgi:DNA modification methylase